MKNKFGIVECRECCWYGLGGKDNECRNILSPKYGEVVEADHRCSQSFKLNNAKRRKND